MIQVKVPSFGAITRVAHLMAVVLSAGRSRARRVLVSLLGLVVVGALLAVLPQAPSTAAVAAAKGAGGAGVDPAPKAQKPHHSSSLPVLPDPAAKSTPLGQDASDLPHGKGQVAPQGPGWSAVRGLPVKVRDPKTPDAGASQQAPATAEISIAPLTQGDGLVVRNDGLPAGSQLRVDYSGFGDVFGGGWGARLRAWQYPACFLTTPTAAGCATPQAVEATNDADSKTLTFDAAATAEPTVSPAASTVAPAAAAAATAASVTVLAASAAGSDSDYAAVPLPPAGEWQTGTGSGQFTYSYPITVPPAAVAGPTPSVSLAYDSQSVDGRTYSENSQVSMLGIGWELSAGGYITREYVPCADDDDAAMANTGDLCWKTDSDGNLVEQLTLTLAGGTSSKLIQVSPGGNQFRLQDDPGWQVTRIYGTDDDATKPDNSDDQNEAFRVRSPDGTTYWYGWGHGSHTTATVPVFGNDANEPCHTSDPQTSWCQKAWQWGLDKVIDAHGNEINYSYERETNTYARFGDASKVTSYDRGGYLSQITYGASRGGSSDSASIVTFHTVRRCVSGLTSGTCDTDPNEDTGENDNIGGDYPDVPVDLICGSAATTCTNFSPAFFTTHRYSSITTARRAGGTTYQVDRYDLTHTLPHHGDTDEGLIDLWLDSVQHTGTDSSGTAGGVTGGNVSLPKVSFDGTWLQNRVVVPDGGRPFYKLRVDVVRSETGGRIDVTYGHATGRECTPDYVNHGAADNGPIARSGSDRECFPRKFAPGGVGEGDWEWWNKYVVTRISLGDEALGYRMPNTDTTDQTAAHSLEGRLRVYDYIYDGAPGWRYRPSPLTDTSDETWDDWRGYETTTVHTRKVTDAGGGGAGGQHVVTGDVSASKIVVFRGLDGSKKNSSSDPDNEVDASVDTVLVGKDIADSNWRQGLVTETTTLDANGQAVARSATAWAQITTATDTNAHSARYIYAATAKTQQRAGAAVDTVTTSVNDGGTDHQGALLGAVTSTTDDAGTPSSTGDDVTTCTTWAASDAAGPNPRLRAATQTAKYNGTACSGTEITRARSWYDNQAYGAAPIRGDVTTAESFADADTSIRTASSFDSYGRVTGTTNPYYAGASQLWASTAYNAGGDSNALTTSVRSVGVAPDADTAGFVSTQTLSPARGSVIASTDPNGQTTTIRYDTLGRVRSVTDPGNSSGTPNVAYEYANPASAEVTTDPATEPDAGGVANGAPRILTTTLRDIAGGAPVTDVSADFYDGWGRAIESQTRNANDNAWLVSATGYDEAGNAWLSLPSAPVTGGSTPLTEPANPTPSLVHHYTTTTFDALGRATAVADKSYTTLNQTTLTSYEPSAASVTDETSTDRAMANTVAVVPGGADLASGSVTKTRTSLDSLGRTKTVQQYGNGKSQDSSASDSRGIGGNADDGYATYAYTPAGQLATITEPLPTPRANPGTVTNAVYSYGYDWLGRKISASDPDTGATSYRYDAAGNTIRVDDAAPNSGGVAGVVGSTGVVETTYDNLSRPILRERVVDPGSTPGAGGTRTALARWSYDTATNGLGLEATETSYTAMGAFTTSTAAYDKVGDPLDQTQAYPASLTGETATAPTDPLTTSGAGTTDGASKTFGYSYNQLGQATSTSYPAAGDLPAQVANTTYGVNGTFVSETQGSKVLGRAVYDDLDRPINVNSGTPASGGATGDPASDQYGLRRGYGYNDRDRLVAQSAATGTTAAPINLQTFATAYDTVGNPLRVTGTRQDTAGGTVSTGAWCYTYDGINRLATAITGAPDTSSGSTACTSTAANAVTGEQENLAYSYSGARLSTVTSKQPGLLGSTSTQTLSYSYTDASHPHATTTMAVPNLLGLTLSVQTGVPTPGTVAYDQDGRASTWTPDPLLAQVVRGPVTSSYDVTGNQIASDDGSILATLDEQNAYNADGTRVVRRTGTNLVNLLTLDGISTTTLFLGPLELTKLPLSAVDARLNFTTPGGTPLAMEEDSGSVTTWRWLNAGPGDTLTLSKNATTNSSTGIERLTYQPFGNTTAGSGTAPGDRGYLDKPKDPTGDIELDHRSYTPSLDVLTTPDPLLVPGDPQTLNPYAYADNNPITMADPSGLMPNPNGPAPACGTSTQVCGPAGDGTSNGYNPLAFMDVKPGDPVSDQTAADARNAGLRYEGTDIATEAQRKGYEVELQWEEQHATPFSATRDIQLLLFDYTKCAGESASASGCAAETAMMIPWFKVGKLAKTFRALEDAEKAANAGGNVARTLTATERRTLDDALRPDKLNHVFDPKHNFGPLVQKFGSREAAMEQIVRSIGGPLPRAGRFEIAQSIGGQTVIIRGAVVDGVPRIGTAFTP